MLRQLQGNDRNFLLFKAATEMLHAFPVSYTDTHIYINTVNPYCDEAFFKEPCFFGYATKTMQVLDRTT